MWADADIWYFLHTYLPTQNPPALALERNIPLICRNLQMQEKEYNSDIDCLSLIMILLNKNEMVSVFVSKGDYQYAADVRWSLLQNVRFFLSS